MSSLTGENIIFVNILDVIDDGQIQVEGESPPDCVLTNDEFGVLTWLPVGDLPKPPDPEPPAGYDAGRNISQELLDTGIIATLDDVEFAGVEIDGDYPYGLSVPTSGIECSGALGVKSGLLNVVGLGGGVPKFQIDGVSGTEKQIITFDANDGLVFSSLGGGALTAGLNIDATKLTDNIVATLDDVHFNKVSTGTINCFGLGGGVPKFQINGVSGTEKQIITFDANDGLVFSSLGGGALTAGLNIDAFKLANNIVATIDRPTFVGVIITNALEVNHINFKPSVSPVPRVSINGAVPPNRKDGYLFVKQGSGVSQTPGEVVYANPLECKEYAYTPYIPPAPPGIDRGWSNKIDIDNDAELFNKNIVNWIISDSVTWFPAEGKSHIRLPFPSVAEGNYRASLTFNNLLTTPTSTSIGNVGYLAIGIASGCMVGKFTLTMDNDALPANFFPQRFRKASYFLTEADNIKQIRVNSQAINSTNSFVPNNNNAIAVRSIEKFELSYVGKTYVVVNIEATGQSDTLTYATYKSSGAFNTAALI